MQKEGLAKIDFDLPMVNDQAEAKSKNPHNTMYNDWGILYFGGQDDSDVSESSGTGDKQPVVSPSKTTKRVKARESTEMIDTFDSTTPSITTRAKTFATTTPATATRAKKFATTPPATATKARTFATTTPATATNARTFATTTPATATRAKTFATTTPATATKAKTFETTATVMNSTLSSTKRNSKGLSSSASSVPIAVTSSQRSRNERSEWGSLAELEKHFRLSDRTMEHVRSRYGLCPANLAPHTMKDRLEKIFDLARYGCLGKGTQTGEICCHKREDITKAAFTELESTLIKLEKLLQSQCDKCPVDCQWSSWGYWDTCQPVCNGFQATNTMRKRRRTKIVEARYGGEECLGEDTDVDYCPIIQPSQGYWSSWSSWDRCTNRCGGTRARSRSCIYNSSFCPLPCRGDGYQLETCKDLDICCDTSTWSQWGAWSECQYSNSFPPAVQRSSRICQALNTPAKYKLCKCRGQSIRERHCCEKPQWDTWSSWSLCVTEKTNVNGESCGFGTRTRQRNCLNGNCPHETCQGQNKETDCCEEKPCCAPLRWGRWGQWSECLCLKNATGTFYFKERDRVCEPSHQSLPACPNHCLGNPTEKKIVEHSYWGQWTYWSECTTFTRDPDGRYCGDGCRNSNRTCHQSQDCPGCQGESHRAVQCYAGPCCEPPVYTSWSGWSECRDTGRWPMRTRTRECVPDARYPDATMCKTVPCKGSDTDHDSCHTPVTIRRPCVDGMWSPWSSWSGCSTSCGRGHRRRNRRCDSPTPNECGQTCRGPDSEVIECRSSPCCVDGMWSAWSSWSGCNKSCGTGYRSRGRRCDSPKPNECGQACQGPASETTKCHSPPCCVDGMWSPWSSWSGCSSSCGSGHKSRGRRCDSPKRNHCGVPCQGPDFDTMECHSPSCCDSGFWGEWRQGDCDCHRRYRTDTRERRASYGRRREELCQPLRQTRTETCYCRPPEVTRGPPITTTRRCQELCLGRKDDYYPSRCRQGCSNYVYCCGGKASSDYITCSSGQYYDSICRTCHSYSTTCGHFRGSTYVPGGSDKFAYKLDLPEKRRTCRIKTAGRK